MNTHESYVSLEVAKLLKQAEFDWEIESYYNDGFFYPHDLTDFITLNYNALKHANAIYSAPTLAVAQKWLREVKNIFLYPIPVHVDKKWNWRYWYIDVRDKDNTEQRYSVLNYITYESALEAGIKKCLELRLK